jgi:hypothetical protein
LSYHLFLKALPIEHRWAWTQQREAEVTPHIDTVGTDLIARIIEDGRDVLAVEALDGHHADSRHRKHPLARRRPTETRLIDHAVEDGKDGPSPARCAEPTDVSGGQSASPVPVNPAAVSIRS